MKRKSTITEAVPRTSESNLPDDPDMLVKAQWRRRIIELEEALALTVDACNLVMGDLRERNDEATKTGAINTITITVFTACEIAGIGTVRRDAVVNPEHMQAIRVVETATRNLWTRRVKERLG